MTNLNVHRRYTDHYYDRSLGSRKIGKTEVDCSFLSSESQWGTLEDHAAGLLRLKLTFHEPADYKLSSAEIRLSFLQHETSCPPYITKHLYPDILCGPSLSQSKSRNRDFEPSVEGFGASVGGVGIKDTADWEKMFRWLLRGSRLPDHDRSYTIAEWSWQANKLNEQSELIRPFQLALVLAHPEPCITTTVDIKGKLRKGWRRYTFGYMTGPSKEVVQVKLHPSDVELASIVENLAALITGLNTEPIAEHQPIASMPASEGPQASQEPQDNTSQPPTDAQ